MNFIGSEVVEASLSTMQQGEQAAGLCTQVLPGNPKYDYTSNPVPGAGSPTPGIRNPGVGSTINRIDEICRASTQTGNKIRPQASLPD